MFLFRFLTPLLLILLFCCRNTAQAQGCSDGLQLRQGMQLEYRTFKGRKNLEYVTHHQVTSLEQLEDRLLAHIKCALFDDKQNLQRSYNYFVGCKDDKLILDKEVLSDPSNLVLFEDKDFSFEGKNLHYPAGAQPGDTLRRAVYEVNVSSGSIHFATIRTSILNRKVEAVQELQTPAGSFRCYRISYLQVLRRQSSKSGISERERVVEYVVSGLGPVRSEIVNRRGKVKKYTVLVSIR